MAKITNRGRLTRRAREARTKSAIRFAGYSRIAPGDISGHASVLVFRDVADDFLRTALGLVTDESFGLADVWHPPPHVLEALLVRLLIGHVHDGGTTSKDILDPVSQLFDRDLLFPADVENLTDRPRMLRELPNRPHRVFHMRERPRLFPVAEHRNGLSQTGLLNEAGNDHPVTTGLARTHGVEQAKDNNRQFPLLMIREREEFVDEL